MKIRAALLALLVLGFASTSALSSETLTWEAAVALAAENHPGLLAARERVRGAEAGIGIANAARLPQLSASGSAERSGRDEDDASDTTSYAASVNLQQDIYTGGRNKASVLTADAEFDRQIAAARSTLAQLSYDLRVSFSELLYAQEQQDLLQQIENRRRNNAELVELRYEGGSEHKGSLAMSRAALYEAQIDVTQAVRSLSTARTTLTRTIGLDHTDPSIYAEGALTATGLVSNVDFSIYIQESPEYGEALATREAAEARKQSAASGYRPTVSLAANAGRYGDEEAFDTDQWTAGIQVSFPLWTGGQTRHEVIEADAALLEADAALTDTVNTLRIDLSEAYASLEDAVEAVSVQEQYVKAAQLRGEISRQQYEDGLLSFENWNTIEDDLISRQKRLLDTRRSAVMAETAWYRASGQNVFLNFELNCLTTENTK